MKLRFTPEAVKELRDILAYIENHSASGARNVSRRIEETLDQLLVHPYSGKRVAFGGMLHGHHLQCRVNSCSHSTDVQKCGTGRVLHEPQTNILTTAIEIASTPCSA
jgi:plasmid stabilization system protein ParE